MIRVKPLVRMGSLIFPTLLANVFWHSATISQSKWKQSEFVLGTFWDPPYSDSGSKSIANFQLAKDAYFNLLTGTQIEPNIDRSFEGMTRALTIAQRVGLKYLVTDQRIFPAYEVDFNRGNAEAMVKDYQSLPQQLRSSLYGYNLCDEPHYKSSHLKRISEWKSFLDTADPEKLAYINLVGSFAPSYRWGGFKSGNENQLLDAPEKDEYERYLTGYVDNLRPSVVSYDHYPFFADGSIRRDYFYNLAVIRKKAGTKPFWAYPMTVGHQTYADPTEPQLNFMYFCPIAYGAKGLVVFCFWAPSDTREYRESLIDDHGRPTRNYYVVKRLNLFVTRVLAPVLMSTTHAAVYHASTFPQNQVFLSDTMRPEQSSVIALSDASMMVGVFNDTKFEYLLVLNKGLLPLYDSEIKLRGKPSKAALSPRVVGFEETSLPVFQDIKVKFDASKNVSVVRFPEFVGGEGRLLRLSKR